MSAIAASEMSAPKKSRLTRPARVKLQALEHLREGYSVVKVAKMCNVADRTLRRWRKEDPDFASAWEDAWEQGTDALVDLAQHRAANGSDPLLMFLIKERRPSYRENYQVSVSGQVEHSGSIEIEDRSASLADVARVLEAVGAIAEHSGATARRSLPAA